MYGAMLAGVDGVIVGAGNPDGLPAVCSRLANHEAVTIDLSVLYREAGEDFYVTFDPATGGGWQTGAKPPCGGRPFWPLRRWKTWSRPWRKAKAKRPTALSSSTTPPAATMPVPRARSKMDDKGQPIYGEQDEPDLEAIRQVGLPFWLAGGYGSREKLQQALAAGASGGSGGLRLCPGRGIRHETGLPHGHLE